MPWLLACWLLALRPCSSCPVCRGPSYPRDLPLLPCLSLAFWPASGCPVFCIGLTAVPPIALPCVSLPLPACAPVFLHAADGSALAAPCLPLWTLHAAFVPTGWLAAGAALLSLVCVSGWLLWCGVPLPRCLLLVSFCSWYLCCAPVQFGVQVTNDGALRLHPTSCLCCCYRTVFPADPELGSACHMCSPARCTGAASVTPQRKAGCMRPLAIRRLSLCSSPAPSALPLPALLLALPFTCCWLLGAGCSCLP